MEKKIISIDENNSLIIEHEYEKEICWANVFLKKGENKIYIGYYSPELLCGFIEWLEYNKDYILFIHQNIHGSNMVISMVYDINNEQVVGIKNFKTKELELKKV